MSTTLEQIKTYYSSQCGGKDKCNCFLHSCTNPSQPKTFDDFNNLKPFIEYVVTTHRNNNPLTLQQLKNYTNKFTNNNELTFEFANL
jgi:hypothetical protein